MIQAALHLTIATLVCVLVGGAPAPILMLCLALALLPDIDTPKSIIGNALLTVSEAIERRVGHRTATHSLLALALVAALTYLLLPAWWLPVAGSYTSHIMLDLLIGRQGVQLFWPAPTWFTITSWRDDGPAPRRMLALLLPALLAVVSWPAIGPALSQPITIAAAFANPIATPTLTRTPAPGVSLSFELPPGIGTSALTVRVGDTVREGQTIARWDLPSPTPWTTPTAAPAGPSPAPAAAAAVIPPPPADRAALIAAQADLAAAQAAQAAERTALRLRHQGEATDALRLRDDAAQRLAQLQPAHERAQAERQHAIDAAAQQLAAAQAAVALATDDASRARAEAQARNAQADLTIAVDAQARMRAEQGVERQRLQAALAAAQADLDALPARQADERAALEARLAADLARAQGRADAAQAALSGDAARTEDDHRRAEATAQAQASADTAATSEAWLAQATQQAGDWATAAAATAAAIPTPWPAQVIARAAGRVARISAEERGGRLVVTIELAAL